MTRTPSRALARAPRRAVPLLLAAVLVAAPRAEAQRVAGSAGSAWTLGMDATFASGRASFDLGDEPRRATTLTVPEQRVRVGYRVNPALQLEVPVALTYSSSEGRSVSSATLGLDANLYLPGGASAVRPFAGVGGRMRYLHADNGNGMGGDVSASQYGYAARAGVDWQAMPMLSVRPALFYERLNVEKRRRLPQTEAFGASFGAMMHFGPQSAVVAPPPFQLGVGADFSHVSFGALDDPRLGALGGGSAKVFQLPTPTFGLFFPVTRSRQVTVGSTVRVLHTSSSSLSGTTWQLEPGAQFNLNPRYRTERNVRLGAHANYQRSSFSSEFDSGTLSRYGAGGDLSMTFPVAPGLLTRVGVGVDYVGAKQADMIPSQRSVSLRFGFDAL